MTDTAELGHYVYAVGDATALHGLDGLTGIDDVPVRCAVAGPLCGLTSVVSLREFRAAQQAVEVSETSWLAGAVRAHARGAWHALERAPVLPMRFGTVYLGVHEVTAMLRRHQASLLAELRRLAGGTEWCLTVRADDTHQDDDAPAEPASGTAWLLSRQAALRAREERIDRLADGVARLRTALTAHARDIVVSRPVNGATGTTRLWLLVDDVPRLHAAVDELRTQHRDVRIELTGPWPAYHFVRTDALRDDTTAPRDDTTTPRDDTTASRDDTAAIRDDTADSGAHR